MGRGLTPSLSSAQTRPSPQSPRSTSLPDVTPGSLPKPGHSAAITYSLSIQTSSPGCLDRFPDARPSAPTPALSHLSLLQPKFAPVLTEIMLFSSPPLPLSLSSLTYTHTDAVPRNEHLLMEFLTFPGTF